QGGTVVEHVFTEAGACTVHLTATDQHGGVSLGATLAVEISIMALQADPLDPSKTVLVVGGRTRDDNIRVRPGKEAGDLKVKINGRDHHVRLREVFAPPISRIVVFGQAGNDNIQVAENICLSAWLYGGTG